jgi:hypothetical protein
VTIVQVRYRVRIESAGAGQVMLARIFGFRWVVEVADDLVRGMADALMAMCPQLEGPS